MTFDADLADARSSTTSVLALVDRLAGEPGALRAPSLLPGWSRAHVVAHLAGNARSHVRMLDGALAGELVAQYPGGPQGRAAEIEALAADPARAVRSLHDACAGLDRCWRRFGAADWAEPVRPGSGPAMRAGDLLWSRRRELEVHAVDLDAGYGPDDWPPGVLDRVVDDVASRLGGLELTRGPDGSARVDVLGTTVSGSASALVLWLTGRSAGAGLSGGPLPDLPEWR